MSTYVATCASARMILEVFCMQFDTYASGSHTAPRISKFSLVCTAPSSFRIDRRTSTESSHGSREDGRDCKSLHTAPGLSLRLRAFVTREKKKERDTYIYIHIYTHRQTDTHTHIFPLELEFFWPHVRRIILALFSFRNAPPLVLPCRTDKVNDDSLDDQRNWNIADSGRLRARIIINAATYRSSGENNWIVKRDGGPPYMALSARNCDERRTISRVRRGMSIIEKFAVAVEKKNCAPVLRSFEITQFFRCVPKNFINNASAKILTNIRKKWVHPSVSRNREQTSFSPSIYIPRSPIASMLFDTTEEVRHRRRVREGKYIYIYISKKTRYIARTSLCRSNKLTLFSRCPSFCLWSRLLFCARVSMIFELLGQLRRLK